jgi:undecaprenyl-diphosphatase
MGWLIIFLAKYLFLFVIALWLVAWWQANKLYKQKIVISTVVAVVIAVVLYEISSHLYYHPRPFVVNHIKPLVAHAADNGFPSEHTLFSVVLATAIIFYRPKLGYLALVLALLVGVGRVAAHVHSPIDIAGGVIFGMASGYLGYLLTKLYFARRAGPTRRR